MVLRLVIQALYWTFLAPATSAHAKPSNGPWKYGESTNVLSQSPNDPRSHASEQASSSSNDALLWTTPNVCSTATAPGQWFSPTAGFYNRNQGYIKEGSKPTATQHWRLQSSTPTPSRAHSPRSSQQYCKSTFLPSNLILLLSMKTAIEQYQTARGLPHRNGLKKNLDSEGIIFSYILAKFRSYFWPIFRLKIRTIEKESRHTAKLWLIIDEFTQTQKLALLC